MRIRHRIDHTSIFEAVEQTPNWFIGEDGTTYGKGEWELAPPPGVWQDITAKVVLDERDGAAQGRVNFYFNESGTHEIRIGYLQFKGAYRLVQGADGLLRVEQKVD